MSELLDDQAAVPTGFIPTLRDALVSVLFSGHTGMSATIKKLTVSPEIARSFKLLAGKLLEQLHARAARVPAISDTVFQARYLQHAHFHRGVLGTAYRTHACNQYRTQQPVECCRQRCACMPLFQGVSGGAVTASLLSGWTERGDVPSCRSRTDPASHLIEYNG